MVRAILTPQQDALLSEERRCLNELQAVLARFDAAIEDQATLERSIQQLDELFLLVVVGEFNAGKSALINALLGQPLLQEGVTPTTTRIHLIKYGARNEHNLIDTVTEVTTAPLEVLREINIVDTPGTNAIRREHEAITREFVPRSDMVLFVTSADRPFTESERAFLQRIREWGKKVVLVVNKIDILEHPEDVGKIVSFIAENARDMLGFTPEIFPISARLAQQAKRNGDGTLMEESRFAPLERYIVDTLDERERIRLKLLNPLGVARYVVGKYSQIAQERLDLLHDDLVTIQDIETQLEIYRQDMQRDFRFRLADVENVLHELEKRGIEFFDEIVRLARVFDLLNKEKVKADFARVVIANAPQQVEQRVGQVIDWLVASELRQWQAVMERIERRQTEHADRMVGRVGGAFDYDRARLLESVGRAAQNAIEEYDHEREAQRLAESVRMAVAGTALIEVSALGLGALVMLLATTTLADVTGLLTAGLVATLGLFVIPARRREAKAELRRKIGEVRRQLMSALTRQFDHELERSVQRIREAIAPYTRFVRAEQARLNETHTHLLGISQQLERLQALAETL
ncbi:MAG: dynamin [Ardenticatenia bacterium]|jgi:small GTP-binding protein|nr:MAG: dynamin [Ardenticatenia bacterium]